MIRSIFRIIAALSLNGISSVFAQVTLPADDELELIPPAGEVYKSSNEENIIPSARSLIGGTSDDRIFAESVSVIARSRERPQTQTIPVSSFSTRASLDLNVAVKLTEGLDLQLSDRLNVSYGTQGKTNLAQELRELYVGWRLGPNDLIQLGRLNVRNGVGIGYSPTDYLRTGATLDVASFDPASIRAGRLGVYSTRFEHSWSGGAAAILIAPKLTTATKDTLGLQAASTNFATRWLATLDLEFDGLSPQLLVFDGGDQRPQFGVSVSKLLSSSVVGYGEYNIGRAVRLSDLAVGLGGARLRSQATLGMSWANSAARITGNLEYHYNGAGISKSDSRNLGANGSLLRAGGLAAISQDPLSRHQIFARVQTLDRFAQGLELALFTATDLATGSTFASTSAVYSPSPKWTFAIFASALAGKSSDVYGFQAANKIMTLQIRFYL